MPAYDLEATLLIRMWEMLDSYIPFLDIPSERDKLYDAWQEIKNEVEAVVMKIKEDE